MDSFNTPMVTIDSTYFYDGGCNNCENPTIIRKEFSTGIIFNTIRESISNQYEHTFGAKPDYRILNTLVDGFVLFNLHKNKNMLKSKDELLKYINNKSISIEEKTYFTDIFLYNQRPMFLTFDEHEYIRSCGNLDEYHESCMDEEDDDYDDDIDIGRLLDNIENTVSIISNNYSALISN